MNDLIERENRAHELRNSVTTEEKATQDSKMEDPDIKARVETFTFGLTAWESLAHSIMPAREPQPRGPYKSTLTKSQKKKRAKKNKSQRQSRRINRK